MFLPHPRVKVSIVGSLRDREVACSVSDHQGSNFESCVWRTVSSQTSHHPQEVLLAQFSLCAQRWPKIRFIFVIHLQIRKTHHQNHICSIFFYILLHDFRFLHDLVLINLCLMFFDQHDVHLTFKVRMVTVNTQIKAVFMQVNYNIINNICLFEN